MRFSIQNGFADFPRVNLIGAATPLQRATGLEWHLKMLDQLRSGEMAKGDDVLFVRPGGVPGLYAYQSVLSNAWDDHVSVMGEQP
jgi:hypothetical protein